MTIKPATTVENWEEYCAHNFNGHDPEGFISGTYETASHVERLLDNATTYEELKRELLNYIKEREEFVQQASNMYALGSFKKSTTFKEFSM